MTIKHYVVNIDPQAEYEWDKVILRNPISGERPDLAKIVADAVENETGSYLIAIDIEVKILEQNRGARIEKKRSLPKTTPATISKLIAS